MLLISRLTCAIPVAASQPPASSITSASQADGALPDHLEVELIELPVAPGLGSIVPEHRPQQVEPDGLGRLVEAALEIGSDHARSGLGAQGEPGFGIVLGDNAVDLLASHVGVGADATLNQLDRLDYGG